MSEQKSAEKRVDMRKVEERIVKAEGTKYLQTFFNDNIIFLPRFQLMGNIFNVPSF